MKKQQPGEGDWRRRQALSLAGQLPENLTDALAVLEFTRELVVTFLQAGVGEQGTSPAAPVVSLVRSRPDLSA